MKKNILENFQQKEIQTVRRNTRVEERIRV